MAKARKIAQGILADPTLILAAAWAGFPRSVMILDPEICNALNRLR